MNLGDLARSIPEAAYEAGERAAQPYVAARALDVACDVLRAAVPLDRACELRRIAADLRRRSDNAPVSGDGHEVEWVGTYRDIADHLSARADEIDGGV